MQLKETTIEGDSKLIIDLVNDVSQLGWNIWTIIMGIRHILERMEKVHLQHIYGEGNKVADTAAAMGFKLTKIMC